jgi:hypothetical protein
MISTAVRRVSGVPDAKKPVRPDCDHPTFGPKKPDDAPQTLRPVFLGCFGLLFSPTPPTFEHILSDVNGLLNHFDFFNFAILIARTFFMIRLNVALSFSLNATFAMSQLTSAVQISNPNFDRSSALKLQDLSGVPLLEKQKVALEKFPNVFYHVHNILSGVDQIANRV